VLGPAALAELRRILEAPSAHRSGLFRAFTPRSKLRRILEGPSIDPIDRTEILRGLTARPASADLATLIAMADTDEVVRLRLLRAIRDLGV
jgi:hypothetical protein